MEKAGGKSNHDTNFSLALGKILNQSIWKTFFKEIETRTG